MSDYKKDMFKKAEMEMELGAERAIIKIDNADIRHWNYIRKERKYIGKETIPIIAGDFAHYVRTERKSRIEKDRIRVENAKKVYEKYRNILGDDFSSDLKTAPRKNYKLGITITSEGVKFLVDETILDLLDKIADDEYEKIIEKNWWGFFDSVIRPRRQEKKGILPWNALRYWIDFISDKKLDGKANGETLPKELPKEKPEGEPQEEPIVKEPYFLRLGGYLQVVALNGKPIDIEAVPSYAEATFKAYAWSPVMKDELEKELKDSNSKTKSMIWDAYIKNGEKGNFKLKLPVGAMVKKGILKPILVKSADDFERMMNL